MAEGRTMPARTSQKLKGGMKVTTLYLPSDLVDKAKARGINISEAVREYLKALLEDEETLELERLEKEIIELEQRLYTLRAKHEALLRRREEKMKKENRERAIREALTKFKAILEMKRQEHSDEEEIRLNRELNTVKAELTRLTGLSEGSQEWTAMMRALNLKGVDDAVKVVMKWVS